MIQNAARAGQWVIHHVFIHRGRAGNRREGELKLRHMVRGRGSQWQYLCVIEESRFGSRGGEGWGHQSRSPLCHYFEAPTLDMAAIRSMLSGK